MPEPTTFAVVIEPPLSVVNGLLDAVRRLAGDLRDRGAIAEWVPPETYAALLVVAEGPAHVAEALQDQVRSALARTEECPVQLMPLTVEADPTEAGRVFVCARVKARGDELTAIARTASDALSACGLEPRAVPDVMITVATAAGDAVAAVRELLAEPRDTPLAGWILGGICLSSCSLGTGGVLLPARLRFIGFRRMTARRESPQ